MSDPVRLTVTEATEAFRGWVELALPALVEVINAKQKIADGKRPVMPYATVERTRGRNLASPHRRVGDVVDPENADGATNELELTRVREIIIEVVFYGDTGPDLCELLPTTRGRLAEQAYLRAQGIAVRELADVLDTLELRDTVHEASAMQEYAVTYTTEDLSQVGTIETLDTMGYTGIDATP